MVELGRPKMITFFLFRQMVQSYDSYFVGNDFFTNLYI